MPSVQTPLFKDFQQNHVFSVSELNSVISEILQQTFFNIVLEGEISNFKPSAAGHIYFTLKDSSSAISAVMFRGAAYKLSFNPKDGDKVRCTGSISVYSPRGTYQIIVNKMEMAGSGNILQLLEERKKKLASEGLFDSANKKPVPRFPKTIGVVTSPTGAAIRDILQITKRRNPNINVIILPAIVQGNEAAPTIVKMIEIANFYKLCDVLIVGRGGGSLEDLLPFSEESVVRAVAASNIPTISAVGHEIDWALCDYAADKRAATPSAAAELAVPVLTDLKMQLNGYKDFLYTAINQKLERTRLLLRGFNPDALEIRFRAIQQPILNRFENAKKELNQNMSEKIRQLRTNLEQQKTILENASPKAIFERGYSMVVDVKSGKIVRNASDLTKDSELEITPACGKITAVVTKIKV